MPDAAGRRRSRRGPGRRRRARPSTPRGRRCTTTALPSVRARRRPADRLRDGRRRPRCGTAAPTRRRSGRRPGGAGEAQGAQQLALGERLQALTRPALDGASERAVPEVGVLEAGARVDGERDAGRQEVVEVVGVDVQVAVGPRVVAGEPGAHRQQEARRDRRRVRRRRDDAGDRFVEARERAPVAQRQHRGRREALRHRGDPEDRARRRSPAVVERAGAAVEGQLPVEHHAPDQ